MAGPHSGAGRERVQAFDLVREPVRTQEIERPVGDGGLGAETLFAQAVKYVVSAQSAVLFEQDFQHPTPLWRELQVVFVAI